MLSVNLLSICDISLSVSDILLIDCDNEFIIDLMPSVKVLSGSSVSICDIFLSISDTLSIDCVNEYHRSHVIYEFIL